MAWLSQFGEKFTSHSGIAQLMDDLELGMQRPDSIMLGGGNPGLIPEVIEYFQSHLETLVNSGKLNESLCHYDGPGGQTQFLSQIADLLSEQYGWSLTKENVALTNGSQSAFFYLFNLYAGVGADGDIRKVLFPLSPEYIGYADCGLSPQQFVGTRPLIDIDAQQREFKYHIDFNALKITDDIGLICVSRPTNPTGNVITDEELRQLDELARQHQIPLLIDNAYGMPFPNMVFNDATPYWSDNTILCLSLSKLGLPGARCGIVVAAPEIIKALNNLSGIINLAPGSIGPVIAGEMVASRDILRLSETVIRPFYQRKSLATIELLKTKIPDPRFKIHRAEGAMFLWLWFDGLPISDLELYELLKKEGVFIIPGEYFFPGIDTASWPHTRQCIRLNYAGDADIVRRGIDKMAEIINPLYKNL
ncbi:valine--pyruvate transaminase [Celerinatantimonas sp. YJH-8]|uniref:valine--pyruvate transaminase n=1 Tax=Celerinatantimonas sp. YJH-8 TaxID=3228714 RepID=UPI0038C9865E